MGVYFKVRSAKPFPKATWSARKALYLYLLHWTHEQQRRAQMRAYEEEVEREPAKMTGSLEQLVELEEKGKWRRVGLPFMAQRPVCASISRSNIVHRRCESF